MGTGLWWVSVWTGGPSHPDSWIVEGTEAEIETYKIQLYHERKSGVIADYRVQPASEVAVSVEQVKRDVKRQVAEVRRA
jgi:hypothetical protein